jgi:hypothetical protein
MYYYQFFIGFPLCEHALEPVLDTAEKAAFFGDRVFAFRTAWINRNGFLYAYQAEAGLNLDLLSTVKRNCLAGVSAFAALVGSLETGAGFALFAGNDRWNCCRLVKLLKKYYKKGGGA